MHYLAGAKGQRRLKVAIDPDSEEPFSLEREAKRMELSLPPYEHTIYDLKRSIEIRFYFESNGSIDTLETVRLDEAISTLGKKDAKRFYRVEMKQAETGFSIIEKKNNRVSTLEVAPTAGVIVLGNGISPMLGTDAGMLLRDKYNIPVVKFGIHSSYFMLADYSNGRFTNLKAGNFIDGYVLMNAARGSGRTRWFGLEGGSVLMGNSKELDPAGWKAGFTGGMTNYQMSFGYVSGMTPKKSPLYYLTVKLPF